MKKLFIILLVLFIPFSVYGQGCDSDTQLLLHFDGTDGQTSTTDENCDGSGAKTVTRNGGVELDTAVVNFGTAASLHDGSGDFWSLSDSSSWDAWADLTTEWTIDFWYNEDTQGAYNLHSQYSNNSNRQIIQIQQGGSGGDSNSIILRTVIGGSTLLNISETTGLQGFDGNWHHYAFIKVDDDWGIYFDGDQVRFGTQSGTGTISAPLRIGRQSGAEDLKGSVDEYRWQKSNYFDASPQSDESDSIDVPTQPYSVPSDRNKMIIFSKREDGRGYNRHTQNFGWKGLWESEAKI